MTHLPSGTVAFLFTDVEGSARRAHRDPVTLPEAGIRRDALLNDAITDHQGFLDKHVGDAVQSACSTAVAAQCARTAAAGVPTRPVPTAQV
jgi:class 3 adenylate cyclase